MRSFCIFGKIGMMDKILKPIIYGKKEDAPKSAEIVETIENSLKELFFIRNPQFKKEMPEARQPLDEFLKDNNPSIISGCKTVWVFYPWLNKIVHCLNEDAFFELRTARNRNLITKEEQKKYRDIKIGVTGLSVGSNILWPLMMSGGPKFLRIADPDTIEISNLNRLNAPINAVGKNKTIFASQRIWETDPFIEIDCWTDGVKKENLEEFFLREPKIDIFIDEIDNLELKIFSRQIAKKNKIPVIMITNVGDKVILDIERYDIEPDCKILHGLLGDIKPEDFKTFLYKDWLRLATKIAGEENFSERLKDSISQIGKEIAVVPQLGTTVTISGAIAAYAVRKLATSQKIKSGRYIFDIEKMVSE